MLNGVLGVLRTGVPWHDLPARYPPYQTCYHRLQQWRRDGTLTRVLTALAEDLRDRSRLDLLATFINASFSSAKFSRQQKNLGKSKLTLKPSAAGYISG